MFNVLSVLQGCIFLFCLFIIQPWFYPVVKYCFNAIYFTRFIFVNSVIVSSIISCNDLYQDFIIMYVWYFVNRNSISLLGAIWPSLIPCTVINPILLTYLLPSHWGINWMGPHTIGPKNARSPQAPILEDSLCQKANVFLKIYSNKHR